MNKENVISQEKGIHSISERELLRIVSCSSFCEEFSPEIINLEPLYRRELNKNTKAWQQIKRGEVKRKDGEIFDLMFTKDLDNFGVKILNSRIDSPILYLNFRDRSHDGTPNASPPEYLTRFSNEQINIPDRSNYIGGTNWYYSSPEYDTQLPGRRCVEFSIVSSDPCSMLVEKLIPKEQKLLISPEKLCHFIDDPFSFIPEFSDYKAMMNDWYLMWWQVVNRGLRGKTIPLPGQTSEKGFKGFFREITANSKEVLSRLGYTHLSGVPTWSYVWKLNMLNGFLPDNREMHEQSVEFFTELDSVEIPQFAKNTLKADVLGDLDDKNPLKSWYAVLPFILEVNPEFQPDFEINSDYKKNFDNTLIKVKETIIKSDKILTYPLRPGKNLWHSLKLT